ncbi:acyl-CoA carboxylase subunit epsilon [Streptomyces sirii]|uniref:acyl-CoA carboxylase subunit epsilon n=1 Tax=Streptomyces sirii TaxID=3127701 RepID=UPI003D35FBD8
MNAFTDENRTTGEGTQFEESTPGEETVRGDGGAPADAGAPAEECPPAVEPAALSLRIERGHAEPEELAAIAVVLCAQLAGLHALAADAPAEERPADRRHPRGHSVRPSACWSGCWTCA